MFMESEFEFDISGISTQASKELESTASPADELFYKGWLLPLHLPFRIQMVEKLDELLSSEIKECQHQAKTEKMGNTKKIDSHCAGHAEEFGFLSSPKACNVTSDMMLDKLNELSSSEIKQYQQEEKPKNMGNMKKIDSHCVEQIADDEELGFISYRVSCDGSSYKIEKETCSDDSAAELVCTKLLDSNQSQPAAIAHKLKAGSKSYLDSNMRGVSNHHSNNSIQREINHDEDSAAARRSIDGRKLYADYSKPFSFSRKISFWERSASISKRYLKPLSFSNRASATQSGAFQRRSTSSGSSYTENDVEEAIAYCKKSLSVDADSIISTSENMEGTTSNPEGYVDD